MVCTIPAAMALTAIVLMPAWSLGIELCDQWQLANPLPVDRDLLGATHGNGRFVIVGEQGTVLTSVDELSWLLRDPSTDDDMHDVVWTGSRFIAVGSNGSVVTSADGAVWEIRSTTSSETLNAVASGGPNIVAVGTSGELLTSPDGIEWTRQTPPTDADLRGVVWTGTEYLAVGAMEHLLASPDGLSWTERDLQHDTGFNAIASSGSMTVAVAENRRSFVTTDGLIWDKGNVGRAITDLIWAGDRFIGSGGLSRYGPTHSVDGLHWRYSQTGAPGLRLDTAASDGVLTVAAGAGGHIAVTRDGGDHYKPVNTFTGLDLYGIATNHQGSVVAAGTVDAQRGAIFFSHDLVNFEIPYDMGLEAIYDVAANDEYFVAVGVINELWSGGGMLLRSVDGRDWGGAVGQVTGDGYWAWEWRSATWDGARFIVVGSGGSMAVSPNASSWYLPVMDTENALYGVASDGQTIVAVGAGGTIVVSDDGQTTSVVHPGYTDISLEDVVWGHGLFVAVGWEGTIRTSSDGVVWTEQTSGTTSDLRGVRAVDYGFVAVGDDGVVLTSVDGHQWQGSGRTDGGDLWDAMPTAGAMVAMGASGLVVQTACAAADEPPAPEFAWRPGQPEEGAPVRFTDLSAGGPTAWHWEFGDGMTADGPAVSHTFAEADMWPVTLTVSNDNGTASTTAWVTVRDFCGAPPPAELTAPASVQSDQPYEVSWTNTIQSHEFGETVTFEATNPAFRDSWSLTSPSFYTSITFSHPWTESASFYYKVRTINYCLDGSYETTSEPVRVDIEPDLENLGEHVQVITAAAHGPGLEGTEWVSDVVVHNSGEFEAPAYLVLLPRDGDQPPVLGQRRWIESGRSMRVADAVAELQSPGYGALLVASDRPLMVGSRTFNDQPEGSFGQYIHGTPVTQAAVPGERVRLIQLTGTDEYRTNLALANPLPEAAEVEAQLYRSNGEHVATRIYDLPGLSSSMDTEVLTGSGQGLVADGYAVVTSQTPGSSVVALASVVDKSSGDPVALPGLTDRPRHRAVSLSDLPLIDDHDWLDLIDAGGVFVALGRHVLAWSRDGIHWDYGYRFDGWWEAANGLGWNGSQAVAVGDRWVYWSPDGISWNRSELTGIGFWTVTWDGSQWAAIGIVDSDTTMVGFSSDGQSWNHTQLDGIRLRNILWVGDRYAAFGPSGLAFSPNAYEWRITDQVEGPIEAMAWNGEELMVVGQQDIFTTRDFFNFERRTLDYLMEGVVWAGDRWVISATAVGWGDAGYFLVSHDGREWDVVLRPDAPYPARPIAWNGELVMAIAYRRTASWLVFDDDTLVVPAAAHLGGFGGSRWRTDLELHNPRDELSTCTVELLERGTANIEPRTIQIDVGPQESVRLPDVLDTAFEFRGAAALAVEPSEGPLMVSSRTYDEAETGTYGQLVPAMGRIEALWPFESGRIIQLAHSPTLDEGFRTNIGVVSRCEDPMEVAVELFTGAGVALGTKRVQLSERGVVQLNNVFGDLTDEALDDAFAVLSTTTPRCSFHAYGSVVDNRSNDPILIPIRAVAPVN
jgi:PKD repeat protein